MILKKLKEWFYRGVNCEDENRDDWYLYKVLTDDIIITKDFVNHPPSNGKMKTKRDFYNANGYFSSPIIIDRGFVLLDGYTSYLIAKERGLKYVHVKFVEPQGGCDKAVVV